MSCRASSSRNYYQDNLSRLNAGWIAAHSPGLEERRQAVAGGDPDVVNVDRLRADGDADVELGAFLEEFVVPGCVQCGGVLKVKHACVRYIVCYRTSMRYQMYSCDQIYVDS